MNFFLEVYITSSLIARASSLKLRSPNTNTFELNVIRMNNSSSNRTAAATEQQPQQNNNRNGTAATTEQQTQQNSNHNVYSPNSMSRLTDSHQSAWTTLHSLCWPSGFNGLHRACPAYKSISPSRVHQSHLDWPAGQTKPQHSQGSTARPRAGPLALQPRFISPAPGRPGATHSPI